MRPTRGIDLAALPPDTRQAPRFRVRPTPTGGVVSLAVVLFILLAPQVADPGMAGFVWAAALGVVVVGVVWPCLAVMLVRVQARPDSGDGVQQPVQAGDMVTVPVNLGPRMAEVSIRWVDSSESTTIGAGSGMNVSVPLTTVRRGRFRQLSIWAECDAPFGMVTASRAITVDLPRALEVGPRSIPVAPLPDPDAGAIGELATNTAGHGGDTTRSLRPYVTGDPAHLVHWPTSARAGALVVREMEPPADRAVAVVVDLGRASHEEGMQAGTGFPVMPTTPVVDGADRETEDAVARGAAVVAELQMRGARVLLCTSEPTPQVGEVGDAVMALRRLAAATTGEPCVVPPGWSVVRITPRGDDA